MKRIIIYTIAAILMTTACQHVNPILFGELSGVYFNNLSGTMSLVDSLDVTFVFESADEVEIPVRLQLVGKTADYDREVGVVVHSKNAMPGVDYVLPEKAYIPAGAAYGNYMVTLKRTPSLKQERKMIELEVFANENFTLPVTEMVQVSDTVSTLRYRIYFSDMFTKAPVAWDANLVGEFTQAKFELICDVLDIDPNDFNDASKITLAKLMYISTEMTYYVREQVRKRDAGESYDVNAFDPSTGLGLVFTKAK